MEALQCKICGGAMVLDASGMVAECNYCGNRFLLNHEDTDYYQELYARMNEFFASSKSDQERKQRAEKLWESAKTKTVVCADGTPIEIKYMHHYTDKDAEVYVARRNIIFHFKDNGVQKIELFRKNIAALDYPSADTRNLESFFPRISGGFTLDDGTHICVVSKDEDEYPLRLFGALSGRHVAWIVSRLENLCCVLEFSSLVHPQITVDTVYINPYTHQASLYGNWWNCGKTHTLSYSDRKLLVSQNNLMGLRNTAACALGCRDADHINSDIDIPKAFADFLRSTPRVTAYDDFAFWDDMLIKAYGERKFITMDTDDGNIYGRKD
ncbi:MAG: hypothetical protein IKT46_00545 [Clostridia bacterium]|nr:hypothetical protein [Clostridia bacterium]